MSVSTFDHRMSEIYQGSSPNARLLAGSVAGTETSWAAYAQSVGGSVLTHLAILGIILYVLTRTDVMAPVIQMIDPPNVVWIAKAGPGGGGGGGGNKMPDPPRKAEIVAPKPKSFEPLKPEPPKPLPQMMSIPAVTSVVELPGAMTQITAPTVAQGPGPGGGGGTGTGSGVGPGTGPGMGPGTGGGSGGGIYREGNGVSSPSGHPRGQAELHRRGDARPNPGHGHDGGRRDAGRLGRQRPHHQVARQRLRPRSGSGRDDQEVALQAGHAPRASPCRCRS